MADTGKQSPLGINVLGSLAQNKGFCINPMAESYMGKCKVTDPTLGSPEDYKPGTLVEDTCLKWLTYAINDGYRRGAASQTDPLSPTGTYTLDATTYNNLLNIGKGVIPALGNTPPSTWKTEDPSELWINEHTEEYSTTQAGAPANTGYPFNDFYSSNVVSYLGEGQCASWYPYLATNNGQVVPNRAITQWGWVRCIALQAWNEFNYNGETATGTPNYKQFGHSFNTCFGYMESNNPAIIALENSKTFLQGAYSNQNDLMSADVSGVCLASKEFGQDLINLGNAIDVSYIKTFGLPSTLLQILQKNNALTQALILALLINGISQDEIESISNGQATPTAHQEQLIYAAMLIITGVDLQEIMLTLNCMTTGIDVLADFVNIKKMFPLSYKALTVPVYNAKPGPTNSKTYYLLFIDGQTNPQLGMPAVAEMVGDISPPVPPAPVEETIQISNVPIKEEAKAIDMIKPATTIEELIKRRSRRFNISPSEPGKPSPPKSNVVEPESRGNK